MAILYVVLHLIVKLLHDICLRNFLSNSSVFLLIRWIIQVYVRFDIPLLEAYK